MDIIFGYRDRDKVYNIEFGYRIEVYNIEYDYRIDIKYNKI